MIPVDIDQSDCFHDVQQLLLKSAQALRIIIFSSRIFLTLLNRFLTDKTPILVLKSRDVFHELF